ncbi:MAG: hypothetical protein HUU01_14755 [Saprospiraceae bacterium]|nr:hypothetical protein [Saprospiraceae bacterium]
MNKLMLSKTMAIIGFVAMLLGAIDPLEGSIVIGMGAGLLALAALFLQHRYRRWLYLSFLLIVLGFAAMLILTWMGGIGGDTGHSLAWGLFVLPYPVGWVMGLVAGVLMFRDLVKTGTVNQGNTAG